MSDIILIVCLLVIALIWGGVLMHSPGENLKVAVFTEEGLHQVVPLDSDIRMNIPGPLGESILEISGKSVRMVSSPCPNKVCIHMGSISKPKESIVCIPNRVYVTIRSRADEVDSITY
ncbi:MAG: NusG domain II-containing protein [Desulfomonilia bacterium]